MPVNYGSRSDRIYAALNPKSGIRDEQKRQAKAAIKAAIGRDSYAEYMDVSPSATTANQPSE